MAGLGIDDSDPSDSQNSVVLREPQEEHGEDWEIEHQGKNQAVVAGADAERDWDILQEVAVQDQPGNCDGKQNKSISGSNS